MKSCPSFFLSSFIAIIFAIGIAGCDTDIDLNAPYKSTPVIIGILDYTADTQFVRINRTFLGSGDISMFAQEKDSLEYNPAEVEAWLFKKRDGNLQDSIELKHIIKPSRNPGFFTIKMLGFIIPPNRF